MYRNLMLYFGLIQTNFMNLKSIRNLGIIGLYCDKKIYPRLFIIRFCYMRIIHFELSIKYIILQRFLTSWTAVLLNSAHLCIKTACLQLQKPLRGPL